MKVVHTILVGLFVSMTTVLHAQVGVYKTADDFLANKMEAMSEERGISTFGGLYSTIRFKDTNGKTVKYKLWKDELWGYHEDGVDYRIRKQKMKPQDAFPVYVTGQIMVYRQGYYRTGKFESEWITYLASDGVSGEMVSMTKVDLKKMMKSKPSAVKALNAAQDDEDIVEVVVKYNEMFK